MAGLSIFPPARRAGAGQGESSCAAVLSVTKNLDVINEQGELLCSI